MELVERQIAGAARSDRDEDLRYPVGMRRAAGNIDHRQAGFRREARAERAASVAFEELQADELARIGRRRRNAAPSRAIADRDDELRRIRQVP